MHFDIAVNDFHGLGVHRNGARNEDEAISFDGLAVDTSQRLGRLFRQNSSLFGHREWCLEIWIRV